MKNVCLALVCSLLMSTHVAAVQVNQTANLNGLKSEVKEMKQLFSFALKRDVSISTKRNIMCQYLPNRMQKAESLNQLDQQMVHSLSKELGKLKSNLNIRCAA